VPIPPSSLRQLSGKLIMPVIVWNRTRTITKRGVTVTLAPGSGSHPDQGPVIRIDRAAAALPDRDAPVLTLGDVAQRHLARVDMAWPEWTVQSARVVNVEPDTPVDPTVAAVVELVENEARFYAQQGGES
jgi:hypothetical protein